jgi:hypothetical protein
MVLDVSVQGIQIGSDEATNFKYVSLSGAVASRRQTALGMRDQLVRRAH